MKNKMLVRRRRGLFQSPPTYPAFSDDEVLPVRGFIALGGATAARVKPS